MKPGAGGGAAAAARVCVNDVRLMTSLMEEMNPDVRIKRRRSLGSALKLIINVLRSQRAMKQL